MPHSALPRRTVALGLPLALGACALHLDAPNGAPDGLLLVYRPVLRFAAPVRPDVETFFARCRADPADPQAGEWLRYALAPAERVLSERFFLPVRLTPSIEPDDARVRLEFRQAAPLVARDGAPAWRQFSALVGDAPAREIRWSMTALATLGLESDSAVRYDTAIELLLESRASDTSAFVDAVRRNRPQAVQAFSSDLLAALEAAYATHFRVARAPGRMTPPGTRVS